MKRSSLPRTRRHVMIYDEDWEWLDQYYGQNSDSRLGVGTAICQIVHHRVKALQQKAIEMRDRRGQVQAMRDTIENGTAEP